MGDFGPDLDSGVDDFIAHAIDAAVAKSPFLREIAPLVSELIWLGAVVLLLVLFDAAREICPNPFWRAVLAVLLLAVYRL
jgi:hypothetical protein